LRDLDNIDQIEVPVPKKQKQEDSEEEEVEKRGKRVNFNILND